MNEDEVISTVDSTSDEPELSLAEFRAKLGLVESETPQQKLDRKQRGKVDAYLERTADQVSESRSFTFSSQEEAAQQAGEFWQKEKASRFSIRKGLSYIAKYRAQRALTKVSDRDTSRSLTTHLEESGSPLLYRHEPGKPKTLSSIDYKPLQSPDFTALVGQLEDPVQTFQRMEQLMGNNWETLLRFHGQDVGQVVLQIASAPEDTVQKVAQTVRSYSFLSVGTYPDGGYMSEHGNYHPDLDLIAQACTQGGFAEELMAQIDVMARAQRLVGRYRDVPLSRVPELAPFAEKELHIAERILRDLDNEEVRDLKSFGIGKETLKQLSPVELKSLVEAISSDEEQSFQELLISADERSVPVGANTYNELLTRAHKL